MSNKTAEEIEEQNTRSFSHWLTTLERGDLHADLSRELQNIVAELNNALAEGVLRPKGTLTIGLNFVLDSNMIEVTPKMKTTLPELPRSKSVYYATPDNNLSRRDPTQQELPLHDITSKKTSAIDIT